MLLSLVIAFAALAQPFSYKSGLFVTESFKADSVLVQLYCYFLFFFLTLKS